MLLVCDLSNFDMILTSSNSQIDSTGDATNDNVANDGADVADDTADATDDAAGT